MDLSEGDDRIDDEELERRFQFVDMKIVDQVQGTADFVGGDIKEPRYRVSRFQKEPAGGPIDVRSVGGSSAQPAPAMGTDCGTLSGIRGRSNAGNRT